MSDGRRSPFQIASDAPAATIGAPVEGMTGRGPAVERIADMVRSVEIFMFMKGEPAAPRCGFSANASAILEACGRPYATFDVLSDEEIRSAAKQFAGWPTFPQVYVRGEFVGGNDIVTEMFQSGELKQLIEGDSA